MNCRFVGLVLIVVSLCSTSAWAEVKRAAFIDNGKIRLGIDLESGGSVFYFSRSEPRRNLLNHFDRGRFIQQSYYGDADGSYWWRKPWRWNPVQGGDHKGHPAKLLEHTATATTLYTKTTPMHWATGDDVTDAVMQQWITLEDDVARIRYEFSYTGDHNHTQQHQEIPAVFVDRDLLKLVFYQGARPWTQDKLTTMDPGWPNKHMVRTEPWAAYVDENDWGVGVYTPGTRQMTCYRVKGESGPKGDGCSYFAPIKVFAVTKGLKHTYNAHVTIGSVTEIRERFYKIRSESAVAGRPDRK